MGLKKEEEGRNRGFLTKPLNSEMGVDGLGGCDLLGLQALGAALYHKGNARTFFERAITA